MKLNKSILVLVTAFVMLMTACVPDDSTAPNNTDNRDQFEGNWLCKETISSVTTTFTIKIAKDTASSSFVKIFNFNNLGSSYSVRASVSSSRLQIARQTVSGIEYEGSGELLNSKLTMTYSAKDGLTTENATASCTK